MRLFGLQKLIEWERVKVDEVSEGVVFDDCIETQSSTETADFSSLSNKDSSGAI